MPSADTLILFDLETSGLDMRKHDIIQIAAVAYSLGRNEAFDEFECKLHFDVGRAEPKALDLNGYDPEVWMRDALEPADAFRRFDTFLSGHKTVRKFSEAKGKEYWVAQGAGYNAAKFDHPWLIEAYKRRGSFLSLDYKVLDVMQLAMWILRANRVALADDKQETVCRHFGIEYDAHDALEDVRAMGKLVGKILYGQSEPRG